MLRARTLLFREQELRTFERSLLLRLKEPVAGQPNTFEYEPVPAEHRQELHRTMAITNMREQIANGPSRLLHDFSWLLRFTDGVLSPVITCDNPIFGGPDRDAIFFPLCWQACLIGTRRGYDPPTDAFDQPTLARIRSHYLKANCRFAYSPKRLLPDGSIAPRQ